MKASKSVNLKSQELKGNLFEVYDLYSSRVVRIQRDYIEDYRDTRSVGCQCSITRDVMCTCRKLASTEPRYEYFSFPNQVYKYSDCKVGSVKALSRKRIKKVYIPETIDRAVGNANLSSYIHQRTKCPQQWGDSRNDEKKTSSKCIGGIVQDDDVCHVCKLSLITQNKSEVTSPEPLSVVNPNGSSKDQNKNKESNVKQTATISIQVDTNDFNLKAFSKVANANVTSKQTAGVATNKEVLPSAIDNLKAFVNVSTSKNFSSDSLVQHIHNLENPSDDKQSKTTVDLVENKFEDEYKKSQSKQKSSTRKPIPDLKSASTLRRRFEALRRGLSKKESKKESVLIAQPPKPVTALNGKHVSIASDPPSLEGRSYSKTNIYKPVPSKLTYRRERKVSYRIGLGTKIKKNKDNPQRPVNMEDERSHYVIKNPEPTAGYSQNLPKKKQGKKFSFFRKKNKEKDKLFKAKKSVTTARCEVKDGLTIKVAGATQKPKKTVKKPEKHQQEHEGVRKAWLENYIKNAENSRNSVHIRWNNKTYATHSSTILELMDSVYQHTGINFRSRSEITTGESSNYRSLTQQRMHFLQQDVQTWMVPKMIREPNQTFEKLPHDPRTYTKNVPIQISNHRWFVDTSKEFSQKIELVLRSKSNSKSSEYVIINIPDMHYSKSSSYDLRTHSSDEKIYKIIEYETPELKKVIEKRHEATGDDIPITGNVKATIGDQNDKEKGDFRSKIADDVTKFRQIQRDVATQGSNVFLPKRCDVIGVGIITQRDKRDGRKPILTIKKELSDQESVHNLSVPKKCDLAESYLQEYCRNWMPLGIDLFPWRVSSSHHSSENNSIASLSRGDVTRSCPNMYEESTVVISSCDTSSCSHCIALEDEKKPEGLLRSKFLNKFRKRNSSEALNNEHRHCPKDSLEVYRKRMLYAYTNQRAKWKSDSEYELTKKPNECSQSKPCWKMPEGKKKKVDKKRVCLPGCEEMSRLAERLSDKSIEGILSYRGSSCNHKGSRSPKCTAVIPKPICVIPQPPCKELCMAEHKHTCTKKKRLSPCERTTQQLSTDIPICVKPKKKTCNRDESDMKEPEPPTVCSTECSNSNKKMASGLHLKMLPSKKKTCCDENLNLDNSGVGEIRLNSQEKITIQMKNDTPSTEETREGLNIKVKDLDGKTIYERIDYKQSGDVNKRELLYDMYKDQQIHRVSTPNIVQDGKPLKSHNDMHESKSDTSVNNFIEINFTLKLKQGDNGTKIDIKNCGDEETKPKKAEQNTDSQQNIYLVQDQSKQTYEPDQKKDLNINIVIKNYNTKPDKSNEAETYATSKASKDNFTERISEKFHTVSTGYSDVIAHPDFSIHRATVDLTTSINESQIQSKTCACTSCVASDRLTKNTSSQTVIKQSFTDHTAHSIKYNCSEENGNVNVKDSMTNKEEKKAKATENSYAETDDFYDYNFKKYPRKEAKDEILPVDNLDEITNDSILNMKLRLRNGKKLLRRSSIIEKSERKKKIKRIIDAILTSDSSGNEDIAVTSNELAKELTYASLDPRCFRDTDSMNNYYQFDSELSMYEGNKHKINTTKVNSGCSDTSDSCTDNTIERCFCRTLATKLNLPQNNKITGCECERGIKKDEEITCRAGTDYLLNLQTCLDVETQNSKYASSKINSTSHGNTKSLHITNASVIVGKNIRVDKAPSVVRNRYLSAFLSDFDELKSCTMKNLNALSLADDEIIVLNSNLVEQSLRNSHRKKALKNTCAAADILHLNETKKAVLEIYAEKIVSKEGEKIVAKLPKFDLDTEYNISNYEEKFKGNKISKRYVKKFVKR